MSKSFDFRCPTCASRLRAPVRLIGKARQCPGCREPIVIRPSAPAECGPMLVLEEEAPQRASR